MGLYITISACLFLILTIINMSIYIIIIILVALILSIQVKPMNKLTLSSECLPPIFSNGINNNDGGESFKALALKKHVNLDSKENISLGWETSSSETSTMTVEGVEGTRKRSCR